MKLCSRYYYAGNQIEFILKQRLFLCQKSEGFALAEKVHHRANVNGVRKDLARLAVEVPDDASKVTAHGTKQAPNMCLLTNQHRSRGTGA